MAKIKEIWKTIKDFPNYVVSDQGRVKRITGERGTQVGCILKPQLQYNGYLRIGLYKNRKQYLICLHKLVLEAFVCPRPRKMQCDHKDCNKTNNYLSNLEWVTERVNKQRAKEKGLCPLGSHNGNSKLKEGEVWLIKRLINNKLKLTNIDIAKMFKVNHRTISLIKKRQIWQHV